VTEQQHLDDDLLLSLALDDGERDVREWTLQHLSTCHRCRSEYDVLSASIEQTLAATPQVEPSPGFDVRVLEAMGFEAPQTSRPRRRQKGRRLGHVRPDGRWRPARWQLVAASVVAGLAVGVGGTFGYTQLTGSEDSQVAFNGSFLWTPSGDQVGTVTRSYIDGEAVFVVSVHSGKVGMKYLCLLRLRDGHQIETADWVLEQQRETWVVRVPSQDVSELVLVANGGAGPVWSTATL
jgi:hypothetical protein